MMWFDKYFPLLLHYFVAQVKWYSCNQKAVDPVGSSAPAVHISRYPTEPKTASDADWCVSAYFSMFTILGWADILWGSLSKQYITMFTSILILNFYFYVCINDLVQVMQTGKLTL